MAEIVVTEFMDEAAVERLRGRFAVHYEPGLADRQAAIPPLLVDARALIVRNRTQVTAAMLDAAPHLACVGRLGVGLDNIDVAACGDRGVAVHPATGANDASVAEYVITAALILLRGAWASSAEVAGGAWPRQALIGREAGGKVMGLVGYGGIARETAQRARALGMRVIACDPYLDPGDPAWGMTERADMDRVFAEADVLSLHVPLTDETRHLADTGRIAAMKPGSVLVNAARGGVVDEDALVRALRTGQLSGAALDVFEEEPLGAASGARFAGLNVLLTPHIAGVTEESNVRVSNLIAEKVAAHLGGA